jgi:hypothetical protein
MLCTAIRRNVAAFEEVTNEICDRNRSCGDYRHLCHSILHEKGVGICVQLLTTAVRIVIQEFLNRFAQATFRPINRERLPG